MNNPGIKPEGWVRMGIEWDPEGLAKAKQAAAIVGTSLEHFIRGAAEKEADRVITSRKGMLDLNAAAELLGVTRKDIIDKVSEGQLRARRIDGEWFIDRESITELAHQQPSGSEEQIELDLRQLVETNALVGLNTEGDAPNSYSLTWCYVNQAGILLCPRATWRKLGRERVFATARDAVRRFVQRREQDALP